MNTFDDDTLLRERLYRIGATAPVPPSDPSEDVRRGRRRARRARMLATAGTVLAVGIIGIAGVALRPLVADRATDPAVSPTSTSSSSVRRAESVAQVLPSTFSLAINLIFERDAALADVPDVVMKPIQEKTDEAVVTWTAKAEKVDGGDQELADLASEIQQSLAALPETRSRARTKETRLQGVLALSALSSDVLAISTLVPYVGDAEIDDEIEALGHLGPAFRSLGEQRNIMVTALAKREALQRAGAAGADALSKQEFAELARAQAEWRLSLSALYASSSEPQRDSLDEITKNTATNGAVGVPAQRAVNQVLANGNLDRVTMTPDQHAQSCTELFRGLQELSVAAANELIADLAEVD
ncbi:Nitrate and nitrite sensing [Nocardioides sp. YR527]|uniref:nitrate- and nitrite sensing domain-containing protein n=1 Tax=Nocardioides sp. YR527 TaxID=1881028 RepID=UPI0008911D5C|nr:nitrate- and nitrite sensing domain-containing protein [Nocardioides sp. YR527]SDL09827.1 Nitrate and nitrite sensing [Nocardioides sp. YR527]